MSEVTVTARHSMPAVRKYIFQSHTIAALTAWFQQAGREGVEDVAVAAGYPTLTGDALVATVLHPDAERTSGWYEQRDGASWDELYAFGHQWGMYYLLQLHTHPPGCSTRHSHRDDLGAFVDRIGFVSIVVPDFAERGVDLHDRDLTVHELTVQGWRVWPHAEAVARLEVVPSLLDLQRDQGGRRYGPR